MSLLEIKESKREKKIKFCGITLYHSKIDPEEYYIKTKILSGLFRTKNEIFNQNFKFQFLKFTIFKTNLKNSYRTWYFLFLPIWIQNANKNILHRFLDKAIKENPQYDDYYIFPSRSGEFFLLMHHFKQWLENNKSKNFVLVFTAKYHINICRMFMPDVNMVYIKRANVPLISRGVPSVNFTYKGKNIYVPTNEKYFVQVENDIRNNGAHYYTCLKQHLNLQEADQHYQISEKTQEKISKIVKYILNNKFIFISPETLSNEPMEKDFWDNLSLRLKEMGYEVFCNAMEFKNLAKDTTSTFLTYEEAIELSKYATAIIGMRSGFLECLSQNDVPLFALYTDFPKRSGFKRLTSNKVLTGYSITKLPNVNKDKIFEYDVNLYENEDLIINDIIEKISNIKNEIKDSDLIYEYTK